MSMIAPVLIFMPNVHALFQSIVVNSGLGIFLSSPNQIDVIGKPEDIESSADYHKYKRRQTPAGTSQHKCYTV